MVHVGKKNNKQNILNWLIDAVQYHGTTSSPSSIILAFNILTWSTGLSSAPVLTSPIRCTTLSPLFTLPKIVCFPSSQGVGARVMKNWLPFVLGPLFAILKMPAPVCFKPSWISSANFSPYMELPPRPVPVGSPVWSMKLGMMRWKMMLL